MLATMLKQGVAAVMGLTLATPAGAGGAVLHVPAPPQVIDGAANAATCLQYGFDLKRRETPDRLNRMQTMAPFIGMAGPPPPPPPAPPPPPPLALTLEATKREDRIEYGAPPVAPGAPMTRPSPYPAPQPPADTERYPDATPNPAKRTADEPVSTFSIDVDTAAYANVRRFIDDGAAPPRDAVRVEELINYFDYGYDRPASAAEPFAITTVVAASPWSGADGRQIVHIGLQGYELRAADQRPLNLTFLVDVSGSMDSQDKLGLAQKSMNLIIDRLRPQDTVAVTYYAEGVGTTLAPTPGTDKLRLRCAVASLYASGGTAGATGMTNAYDQAQAGFSRDKVNRILMFTDGDFNVGVTDDRRIEDYVADKRATGIYLSVYGFGRGNYQDARMQTIAQSGNGVAAHVDDLNEARRLFGPLFDRGAFPIADDVKIQVEFNPARVSEYRLIGYETRLLNEEDFANDRIDAGEVGSGASVTALYEITPVGAASQIPDRRYDANRPAAAVGDPHGEIGFIQVRYKRPGEATSRLIQQPIANAASRVARAQPPESTRWALAVAAFGQKLRADPWMAPGYDWSQVLEQAQGARGADPYGERAEFVQMVRAAGQLPARSRP